MVIVHLFAAVKIASIREKVKPAGKLWQKASDSSIRAATARKPNAIKNTANASPLGRSALPTALAKIVSI